MITFILGSRTNKTKLLEIKTMIVYGEGKK